MRSTRIILFAAAALLYGGFLYWYGGRGAPLTPAEVDAGLAEIEAIVRSHGRAPMPELQQELRTLLSADDGDEFVMVNLIRYRKKALYPPGSPYGDDPMAADSRYNRVVIPELLKRGSLPLFKGQVSGRFIHPAANDDWDAVALVRYRSRRDLLSMAGALAQGDGDIHKWASIEKTQVFPAHAVFGLFLVRSVLGLLLLAAALLADRWIAARQASGNGSPKPENTP